jgi:hypothetical protein
MGRMVFDALGCLRLGVLEQVVPRHLDFKAGQSSGAYNHVMARELGRAKRGGKAKL